MKFHVIIWYDCRAMAFGVILKSCNFQCCFTQAITLGEGWLAVCTDKRIVRIFTLGGIQKEIFSIPGPVVCMSGHESYLMVVYHSGRGTYFPSCVWKTKKNSKAIKVI